METNLIRPNPETRHWNGHLIHMENFRNIIGFSEYHAHETIVHPDGTGVSRTMVFEYDLKIQVYVHRKFWQIKRKHSGIPIDLDDCLGVVQIIVRYQELASGLGDRRWKEPEYLTRCDDRSFATS